MIKIKDELIETLEIQKSNHIELADILNTEEKMRRVIQIFADKIEQLENDVKNLQKI